MSARAVMFWAGCALCLYWGFRVWRISVRERRSFAGWRDES